LACFSAAGDDKKAFCPNRYILTVGLKSFLREIVARKAYFSQNSNFVVWKMVTADGAERKYAVFFDLSKAYNPNYNVMMFVRSAYIKDHLPKNLDSILFKTLFSKIHRGETVISPRVFQKHRFERERK
jgi:hypothetical protein